MKAQWLKVGYALLLITGIVIAFITGRTTAFRDAQRGYIEVDYVGTSNYINRDLKVLRIARSSNPVQVIDSLESWISYRLPQYNDYGKWVEDEVDDVTLEAMAAVLEYENDFPGAIDRSIPKLSMQVVKSLAEGKVP